MKISFVITNLSNGGAERVLSLIANYFSGKGYEIKIIMVQDDKVTYPVDSAIKIQTLGTHPNKIISRLKRVYGIRKEVKGSDIVISFLWHINIYTIIATRFLKLKVIISDRSDPSNELGKVFKLKKWIRNFFYKQADRIVFQVSDAREHYPTTIKNKGVIIPNPVSPNLPEYYKGERRKVIVSLCRLSAQKNIKMTIDAFHQFCAKHKEYSLVIYGEGELRGELEEYINKINLEDKIFLPGFSDNVHQKIFDCAMYISSSDYEGISNSMLECLAIGIPSILTDCPVGGARMFVENEHNGVLIKVKDTEGLYKAMVKIAENQEFSEYISKNALMLREKLSQEVIGEEWVKILK